MTMDSGNCGLLTDLYQLNMLQAYLEHGVTGTAVFEFFVRAVPEGRNFLIAAGLEPAFEYLENLRFGEDDLAWLAGTGRFSKQVIEYLRGFRFAGAVDAMPEGTVFFANEPVLQVTAPLPAAQLVESRLINLLQFQTMVASKAARMMLAAPGRLLVDFGLRRAHGAEAGVMAARASYLAGFAGSATVLAGKLYGMPLYGTMAHSFIEAWDDEAAAFEAFARARPDNLVLLLDTYDTLAAARKVVALAPRLRAAGIAIRAVRLDSGDLAALAQGVRQILDAGGLDEVTIFASGGLDENEIARLLAAGAPIAGFGVGTSLTTSFDRPALDCAYKLQEYADVARRKYSSGKATWPGRKQVWRRFGADGRMAGDTISLADDRQEGEPLLAPAMREGRRVGPAQSLAQGRERVARELERLPEPLRGLAQAEPYAVSVGDALKRLVTEVDRRLAGGKP
ncbi:MAG TPA: nicotinate phosphoribosyltransferase [Xanthobacteraceae bacterium]|jgi:nicotinate phosphoribosyltransferase|nr:nicotinate phosphoribosyltransferase [Xanthobacteraceae bacterium]